MQVPGSQLLGILGELDSLDVHRDSRAAGDPDELYPVGAMTREPVFQEFARPWRTLGPDADVVTPRR